MKNLILFAAASLSLALFADDTIDKAGGIVYEPGIGKGFVAVVNAQAKVPAADIAKALDPVLKDNAFLVKYVKTEAEAKGAGLVLRVIEDNAKPPMLAAPEASWAEVNVARLDDGLTDADAKAKALPTRTQKMMLRAFAYAAGAGGSSFPGNLMDVVAVGDLDKIGAFLPVDTIARLCEHLAKRGVEPRRAVPYRFACEEGWAPAPTNELQKAIYDEIKNPETRWDKDFGDQKK